MAGLADLVVKIGADLRGFNEGMATVGQKLSGVGKSMTKAGATLTASVTAPVMAMGASVVKASADFETGMNRVQALTGASKDQFVALEAEAKRLGATTAFSASDAADAMGFLAMAGFDSDQILGSMNDTLNLAAAAQMDLGSAADTVSNIMTGYGLSTEQTAHATDVLVKTMTSANTDLAQLGEAMKYAGPVASSVGVSFEEAAAAIGLMGNAGIQGSMAGTSLRNALLKMKSPTEDSLMVMERLGASMGLTAQEVHRAARSAGSGKDHFGDMAKIVDLLSHSTDVAGDAVAIFGVRAGPAMAALVSQGSESLRDLTGELESSGGTAKRIADVQMSGFNGAMAGMRSAFEALQISIGQSGLLDLMTGMVNNLASFTRELATAEPATMRLGIAMAAVAASVGPTLLVTGKLVQIIAQLGGVAKMVGLIFNPYVLLFAAVAAAAYLIYENFDVVSTFVSGTFTKVMQGIGPIFQTVKATITSGVEAMRDIVSMSLSKIRETWDTWGGLITDRLFGIFQNVKGIVVNAFDAIVGVFGFVYDTLIRIVSVLADAFMFIWSNFGDEILSAFGFIWTTALTAFEVFTGALSGVFNVFAGVFTGDFSRAWDGVKDIFNAVWQGIKDVFINTLNFLFDAIPGGETLKEKLGLTAMLEGSEEAQEAFENLADAAGEVAEGGMDLVTDAASSAKDSLANLTEGVKSGEVSLSSFSDMAGNLTGKASELVEGFYQTTAAAGSAASSVDTATEAVEDYTEAQTESTEVVVDNTEATEAATEATEGAAEAQEELADAVAKTTEEGEKELNWLEKLNKRFEDLQSKVKSAALEFVGENKLLSAVGGLGALIMGPKGLGDGLFDLAMTAFPGLGTAIQGVGKVLGVFGIDVDKVLDGVKNKINAVGEGIKSVAKGAIESVKGLFAGFRKESEKEAAMSRFLAAVSGAGIDVTDMDAADKSKLKQLMVAPMAQGVSQASLLQSLGLTEADIARTVDEALEQLVQQTGDAATSALDKFAVILMNMAKNPDFVKHLGLAAGTDIVPTLEQILGVSLADAKARMEELIARRDAAAQDADGEQGFGEVGVTKDDTDNQTQRQLDLADQQMQEAIRLLEFVDQTSERSADRLEQMINGLFSGADLMRLQDSSQMIESTLLDIVGSIGGIDEYDSVMSEIAKIIGALDEMQAWSIDGEYTREMAQQIGRILNPEYMREAVIEMRDAQMSLLDGMNQTMSVVTTGGGLDVESLGSSRSGTSQTIVVNLDGRTLAEATAENMPEVLEVITR